MKKDIVVSGVRPTGNIHLGNYFGAIKNFVKMQEQQTCYFFIADYHSLTTHPNPADLHGNVRQALIEFLACGIDPEKSTLYLQSDIPQTAELYLMLNMNAYLGELQKVVTFKEKARKQPNNVNAGLLTYPTLMAADILIHQANKVPVGKDQEQHLEMTRTYARRFNKLYATDFLPEPTAYNFGENLVKIPGLDGSGKMGKSEGGNNAIFLNEEPKILRKKIMRAKTDSGPTEKNSPMSAEVSNLFQLMRVLSKPQIVQQYIDAYNDCTIRYGDMKKQLAEDAIAFTEPFREKIKELEADPAYIAKIVKTGKEKARESAEKTIQTVREIVGFKPF
jgi:tryptophanyl-tRNA synthetase